MSVACSSCGKENPDGFAFCGFCSSPLADQGSRAPREERKVVSCLFCDLVGFTSRAERLDPEEVRSLLQPYHARLRAELERHGGTVEKFIGDAVMALFGAPVAHEDDPERAVRAALAIRDWAAEGDSDLQVRLGITTGEALVALSSRPLEGEGMASGDVVNTAARIQAAAPVGGILVDEMTYRATERAIEYRAAEPALAKGKLDPIPVWEALRARARVGVERLGGTPLVGREHELGLLRDALARVKREREPQLVTLVGVPGIGKSRLVYELFKEVEADPDIVYWRHGRSLPYGDGVTFWALAEIVKAQAGILESDSSAQAEEKLQQVVQSVVTDAADAIWVERHLRPLAGLESDEVGAGDRRTEGPAAWRRFLAALAEQRPLVLVFEDLHWADDLLLEFVDQLVDRASGVPMLVLCTARPELLSRQRGWAGGKQNAATLSLSPLADAETTHLIAALLEQQVLAADIQAALLESAGGNPLYAEQYTRMLIERGTLDELPETVQGIIAARLDVLSADEKSLLQDAAVVGKVFWLGSLEAISGIERWRGEEVLHGLERRQFVQHARRSSVAGESEYAFRHALLRDVAYGQIPRIARADKHRLAAEWIDSMGRPEDHAELLAHHYSSALELARATGQSSELLRQRARFALRDAGDRALALNAFAASVDFYRAAAELWPPEDPGRPALLLRYGHALLLAEERGDDVLAEARDGLIALGDRGAAAEAEALAADLFWRRGMRDRTDELMKRAAALAGGAPPSRSKAFVLVQIARFRMLQSDDYDEAIRSGREALALAEELGLDELRAWALNTIGTAALDAGDPGGFADLERSIAIARSIGSPEVIRGYNNLATQLEKRGDLMRAAELVGEAIKAGERFGNPPIVRSIRGTLPDSAFRLGDWDEALRLADAFVAEVEAGSPHHRESNARQVRGRIRSARGDEAGALEDARRSLDVARSAKDPQELCPALAFLARASSEASQADEARAAVDELLAILRRSEYVPGVEWADIAVVLSAAGRGAEVVQVVGSKPRTKWGDAARLHASGDLAGAADLYAEIRSRPDEAYARLSAAEELVAAGRRPEAEEQLQQALAIYRSVGATRYIRQGEALLVASA